MNKRAVLGGAIGAAIAVAGSLIVAPAAAQAAYVCRSGEVCIYQHWNLTGSVAVLPELRNGGSGKVADFRNHRYTNGENLNDSASSVINLSNRSFYIYSEGNYNLYKSGRKLWVTPGVTVNFGPNWSTVDFSDVASSVQTF